MRHNKLARSERATLLLWVAPIVGLLCSSGTTWRHNSNHNDTQHSNSQHNNVQHNDIQHNGIQHNDIQYNDIQHNNT
jgi:hypothetical protein